MNTNLKESLVDGGVVDEITDLDFSAATLHFFAGYTAVPEVFDPSVVIVSEDLGTKMSTSEYWSNQVWNPSSEQSDQSKNYTIGIGSGNGLIVQSTFNESDILKGSPDYIVKEIALWSTGLNGEVGWSVGCTFTEFTPVGSEDECRQVIQSFRLMK